jgi:hypothetical protein
MVIQTKHQYAYDPEDDLIWCEAERPDPRAKRIFVTWANHEHLVYITWVIERQPEEDRSDRDGDAWGRPSQV